jgi:hypothetical protein
MKTHYEQTLQLYRDTQNKVIEFGRSALIDIAEGKTIRQMSIDLCGNNDLEDRIGRWIQAAEWDKRISKTNGRLYEEAREWLSPSHFTVLEKIATTTDDFEYAHDLMEQTLVRNLRKQVIEVKPVTWLQAKLSPDTERSTAEIFHRLWKWAGKAYTEAWSELERKGNDATAQDRRRVRILKLVIRIFEAQA